MSELAKALVEAQKEYPEVEKTATANYGKYATLDSLISKTLPVLNRHGLSIQQFPAVSDQGLPVLRTIIRHTSGESEQADMPLFVQKQDMQALGAAITYARRYSWSAVLGIASEHDDDAASISNGSGGGTTGGAANAASTQHKSDHAAASSTASQFEKPADPQGLEASRADAVPVDGDAGSVILTFGKHKGKPIREVPQAYLTWWLGQEPPKTDDQKRQRAAAEVFLQIGEGLAADPDSDIPF